MVRDVMVAEIVYGHKRVIVIAQAEIEANADVRAVIPKSDTGDVVGFGRQRRPAAVTAVISPTHPGRAPGRSGRPDPTGVRMMVPSSIMERSPSPRVVRQPVPPAVAVNPASTMAIRAPG